MASAVVSTLVFAWIVTGGTGRFLTRELLGDFYDHQAASLLHGRLDVPFEAVSFEAFVSQGKYYGYFGPTPALLRIPFTVLGVAFGELSRPFLVAYFAAALLAAYLLLLHAVRTVRGAGARPGAIPTGLFVASAGLGSTLVFLGSRAFVHHEAILCGAVFALFGVWCALRHLAAPAGRWWIGSLACGVLAVHARPPMGLFALATTGVVALLLAWRAAREARAADRRVSGREWRRAVLLLGLAVAGVLSFNALSYLKFGTFEACPLRLHVQYTPERLAALDGRQFHLANLLPNATAYLLRPGLAPRPHAPYLVATAPPMPPRPARLDLVEPMVGLPFAMPALMTLAALGGLAAFRRSPASRPALLTIGIGALPMTASLFAAVALAFRYTADFCPILIAAGSFGAAGFDALAPQRRRWAGGSLGALVALNSVLLLALTLHHQGEVAWGVSPSLRRHYAAGRERVDALFGTRDPAGYAIDQLPVAANDALTALYLARQFAKAPATLPRALQLADEALREYPDNAHMLVGAGEIYALSPPRLAQATACLERGVKLNPGVPLAHHALADCYVKAGRDDEAIATFREALRWNARWAPTHNNLAFVLLRQKRFDEALAALDQAQRLDPAYAPSFERFKAYLKARP